MKTLKKFCATAVLASSAIIAPKSALACGFEPYIATVCSFAFTFCPRGYAEANGSLLPIAQNTALFSLVGTTYGGNGTTTFALPDLRGRSAVGQGTGPGLSAVTIGQQLGAESTTLTVAQLPAHSHTATLRASTANPSAEMPTNAALTKTPGTETFAEGATSVNMGSTSISVGNTGGNSPVAIRSPGLGLITCIATEGIYPSRP